MRPRRIVHGHNRRRRRRGLNCWRRRRRGLEITVCHLPPGTSKWNKIEHKLFSHISMNWRGRPLSSHEVIVNSIAATTTKTGLTVQAELDTGQYPTGVKIPDNEMASLETNGTLHRHQWHPEWNYTLKPNDTPTK